MCDRQKCFSSTFSCPHTLRCTVKKLTLISSCGRLLYCDNIISTSQNDVETVASQPQGWTWLINILLETIQAKRSGSGFNLRMFWGCTDTIRIPCVTSWLPETYHRMLEIRFQSLAECRWNKECLVSIWMHECWSGGGWWSSPGRGENTWKGCGLFHWTFWQTWGWTKTEHMDSSAFPTVVVLLLLLASWGHVLAKELFVNDR